MILAFDTETTGMLRWHDPNDHPLQPRIVQLGAALYHPDGTEISAVSLIINTGRAIDPSAAAIHGIDEELMLKAGISPLLALRLFEAMAVRATLAIAHNVNFDSRMLSIEFMLQEMPETIFGRLPTFCTMQATTSICRIPHTNGRGFKWPKLQEAYKHFFGENFVGAHDALSDVRACAKVYFELMRRNQARPLPQE